MKGAGWKCKLEPDNPGLIAGAAALNGSTSPKMATEICNAVNQLKFPEEMEVAQDTRSKEVIEIDILEYCVF